MTGIEIIISRSRAEWLAARRQDVTASVIAALFRDADGKGVHPFTTELDLYLEKVGTDTAAEPANLAMKLGLALEPVAVEEIRAARPELEINYSASTQTYYRDPEARLGATPDVIAKCPTRGIGIIQIKTAFMFGSERKWIGDEGEPEAPLWIHMQAEVERHLTGGEWAEIARLSPSGIEFYQVPQVDGLISAIERKVAAFWDRVERRDPPQFNFETDAETIAKMYAVEDPDHAIDLTDDERIERLIARRAECAGARRIMNDTIKAIDAEIAAILGDASEAILARGRRITRKTERRAGGYVPPSEARRTRLPKPLQEEA